ncbi:hypothetical protein TNCV_1538391 [Trichonephila clavipes]|nr:hypothetical protein TNCV_1538391 [Trichonephila clavipes]
MDFKTKIMTTLEDIVKATRLATLSPAATNLAANDVIKEPSRSPGSILLEISTRKYKGPSRQRSRSKSAHALTEIRQTLSEFLLVELSKRIVSGALYFFITSMFCSILNNLL